jgi:protein-tyrosine phosphatase
MKKVRVLFVCLGNICRSPLAEAIFKEKVKKAGLEKWIEADSCGTSNYHIGGSPDPRTIANATKNGITIDHCGRQLCIDDLETFDFILAMDKSNYKNILAITENHAHKQKVMLMREFDPIEKGGEVPDPYYGGEQGFQHVYDILDRSMENFLAYLKKYSLTQNIASS